MSSDKETVYQDKYFRTRLLYQRERDTVWPIITDYIEKKFMPQNSVVLDLGAAYCNFINNIKFAQEKHALDISPITQEYAAKDVLCHIQDVADLSNLQRNHFDVVFASHFFEHLDRDQTEKTLEELKKILKPNGLLIALQPNFKYAFRQYFDDFTHKQIFTETSFADLLSVSGYKIIKVIPKFLPFSLKSKLPKHPLLVKIYLLSPVKPFAGSMLVVASYAGKLESHDLIL